MSKSKILWLTLVVWSILFAALLTFTFGSLWHDAAEQISTWMQRPRAHTWDEPLFHFSPAGHLIAQRVLLLLLWFAGALAIFISAIDARKDPHRPKTT